MCSPSSAAAVRCGCQAEGVLGSRRLGGRCKLSHAGALCADVGLRAVVLQTSCTWVGVQELGVPSDVEGVADNQGEAMVALPTDPEENKEVRALLARLMQFQACTHPCVCVR